MRVLIQIKFLVFWENLMWWLNSNSNFWFKIITLLLDNCPIHKSARVKSYLTNSCWNTIFQTAYSPQLARVEKVFHIIKNQRYSSPKYSRNLLNKSNSWAVILHVMRRMKRADFKMILETLWGSETVVT